VQKARRESAELLIVNRSAGNASQKINFFWPASRTGERGGEAI
jgi:hypothetical protein